MTTLEIRELTIEQLTKKAEKLQASIIKDIDLCHPIESKLKRITPLKKELERRGYYINVYNGKVEKKNDPSFVKNLKVVPLKVTPDIHIGVDLAAPDSKDYTSETKIRL